MRDSFLVNGVAFKKTFSYAGFEQQPKKFVNPKILLLNIELELKSEKENAEIRQDSFFFFNFKLYIPIKNSPLFQDLGLVVVDISFES